MADIQKLIETILSGKKRGSRRGRGGGIGAKVYQDEPILMTAAQMKNYMPPRYRQMRKLAGKRGVYYEHDADIFYKQAKFMEDLEDDFDYRGEFVRYFPTYQSMNDQELRGYFSWRTKLRRGVLEKTSLSFAFVYIYELLNQIGVSSPLEGYWALESFWKSYRELDAQIDRYVMPWLRDYIVYHNLDKSLLEPFLDTGFDQSLLTLLHCEFHSPEEVFGALNALSSYNMEHSIFYKKHPEDVREVVAGVFAALWAYYAKNRKHNLCEKFFGMANTNYYSMFQSAVFRHQTQRPDFVYEISEIHKYHCVRGRWSCQRYMRGDGKNRQVGALLKTIDFQMRLKYGFEPGLKEPKSTKIFLDIIKKEIDRFLEEKSENQLRKVEIDVSKLQAIRKTALETQGRLIVEDLAEIAGTAGTEVLQTAGGRPSVGGSGEAATEKRGGPGSEAAPETRNGLAGRLGGTERELLGRLLRGQAYDDLIRSKGLLLSVLIDTINESLFDVFCDTVILYDGDSPELVEDYTEELKGMIEE